MPHHPALEAGRTAVITGAGSGIGLAMAERFAGFGMNVVLADVDGDALETATDKVAAIAGAHGASALAVRTDVSNRDQVERLATYTQSEYGVPAVLVNNAGREGAGQLFSDLARWQAVLDTNLWGVIHGIQLFVPDMMASGAPGLVINTGSKQGITTPPGDTAYNVTKAGVKVVSEALAHELRNAPGCRMTAHLLIPGFTFTGFTRVHTQVKPAGAWTPEQVIDHMLAEIEAGSFYILCPDNEVSRAIDERRIRWAAEDIINNRPPLSRWHADWKDAFARYMAEEAVKGG